MSIIRIICGKQNTCRFLTSHDVFISSLSFTFSPHDASENVLLTAPRIPSTKHKIAWSPEGILAYKVLLADALPARHNEDASDDEDPNPANAGILLQMTTHVLTTGQGQNFNKSIDLISCHS